MTVWRENYLDLFTYVAGGMIPLSPKRSRSDLGKANPLLKMGSEINALDFLWTISALKYLPLTILVEIHLGKTIVKLVNWKWDFEWKRTYLRGLDGPEAPLWCILRSDRTLGSILKHLAIDFVNCQFSSKNMLWMRVTVLESRPSTQKASFYISDLTFASL